MAEVRIVSNLNQGQLHVLLQSRSGPLARRMLRSGTRVANQAKKNLLGRGIAPRRVNTGRLLNSITVRIVMVNNLPAAEVGTNVHYAKWVHSGTGIYGPRASKIYPVHGDFLRWKNKRGAYVYARSVRGMEANHFLSDALHEVFGRG